MKQEFRARGRPRSGNDLNLYAEEFVTSKEKKMHSCTGKNILLHVTIFNIWGAWVSLNKTNYLRLQCAGNPIGAYADSYLFNTTKDVTNIPWWNKLQANESFSVDIKAPLDTDVLKDFNKFDGHCFLYNDNIKEINEQNNNASFSLTVKN